jgi:CBS domain-containing protein
VDVVLGGDARIHQILAHKGYAVETVELDVSVLAAVRQMHVGHVGSVVVVDGDGLVGILTERDVLVRVVAPGLDPATVRVRDVMMRELVVIDRDVTVGDAIVIITNRRCRHLPVIESGRLCGLVSAGDLTAWLVREQRLVIDDLQAYITR